MSVLPIVIHESDVRILRRKSEPVEPGARETRRLLVDLKDTLLHHEDGVGLAAPQLGIHRRAIAVCLGSEPGGRRAHPVVVVNPVVVEAGRELPGPDGCLSIPGLYAETVRPHILRLRGLDERGLAFEWTLEGFDAVVVHHELDHLDGVLFIDRIARPELLFTADEIQGRERSA